MMKYSQTLLHIKTKPYLQTNQFLRGQIKLKQVNVNKFTCTFSRKFWRNQLKKFVTCKLVYALLYGRRRNLSFIPRYIYLLLLIKIQMAKAEHCSLVWSLCREIWVCYENFPPKPGVCNWTLWNTLIVKTVLGPKLVKLRPEALTRNYDSVNMPYSNNSSRGPWIMNYAGILLDRRNEIKNPRDRSWAIYDTVTWRQARLFLFITKAFPCGRTKTCFKMFSLFIRRKGSGRSLTWNNYVHNNGTMSCWNFLYYTYWGIFLATDS